MSVELLVVKDLEKKFRAQGSFLKGSKGVVNAVNKVSFVIHQGETLSVIGETGSGKTTTGKLVLRLIEPTSGEIFFEGKNILKFDKKELKKFRRNAQMIFQDPFASLNPRQTIEEIVGLPLVIHNILRPKEIKEKVVDLLEKVGVTPAKMLMTRNPLEFSGGQRQRIGIARALALNPKFIVADEPVASLDVSIRAQILNLLKDLKDEFNLTYLLIAHDLTVVKYMSDWVMIMYLGRTVEMARIEELFMNPQHPYTKSLIDAIPIPNPHEKIKKIELKGEIPSPINLPSGCTFHTRCPYYTANCINEEPLLEKIGEDHFCACHNCN